MVESGEPRPQPAHHEHIESRQAELQERLSRRRGLRSRRRPPPEAGSEEAWLQELQQASSGTASPAPAPEGDAAGAGARLVAAAADLAEVGRAATADPGSWGDPAAYRWLVAAAGEIERLLADRPLAAPGSSPAPAP